MTSSPVSPHSYAIVFDFDGVLADSEAGHERALLEISADRGMGFTHEQYVEAIIGFDDRDAFAYIAKLSEQTLSPEETRSLIEEKTARFEAMVEHGEIRLFDGAADLARAAKQAGPVAVCSGALKNEVLMILESNGLQDVFEIIVTADDVEAAKPDPAGYLLTAQKLGIPPERCITIEDTPTGLSAARDAGYRVAAVGTSFKRADLGTLDLYRDQISEIGVQDLIDVFG